MRDHSTLAVCTTGRIDQVSSKLGTYLEASRGSEAVPWLFLVTSMKSLVCMRKKVVLVEMSVIWMLLKDVLMIVV